jgi:hypothetical protein
MGALRATWLMLICLSHGQLRTAMLACVRQPGRRGARRCSQRPGLLDPVGEGRCFVGIDGRG